MPDLSNYKGDPPNDFAMSFIALLEAEGFGVAATEHGRARGNAKTLRITWRKLYIGQMHRDLWGGKVPFACLYRFSKDGGIASVAKAPQGFDKDAFAKQHVCNPDKLYVSRNDGESYLWVQDHATGLLLMRDWARRIDEVFFPPTGSREAEQIQDDLRTILEDGSKTDTERLAEVAVRLGQGKFRADLEREFANACAVTRLAVAPALRASHIVPWRDSVDAQRLDPKNGLLLSANLDALFDRYMITFRPDGVLVVSTLLTPRDKEMLGPLQNLQSQPCDRRAAYLKHHNARFDRFEQERLAYVSASKRL
ncbi:HNH endonuclease [Burkholderia sp. R-69980]|nr:HNH endonuclease [Burkholderia sp. R-69980]